MNKNSKKKILWFVIPVMLLGLAVAAFAAVHALYIFPEDRAILRSSTEVDFRDTDLSYDRYRALCDQLPQAHILWMIPIGDTRYDCAASEIAVNSVSMQDISLYHLFDDLTTIDATTATCYTELIALQEALPDCNVEWVVHIGGSTFSPALEQMDLNGTGADSVELLEKLELFPALKRVEITDILLSADEKRAFLEKFPSTEFVWQVEASGTQVLNTAVSLSFEGQRVDVSSLLAAAEFLPMVESIDLRGSGCTIEELLSVQEAYSAAVSSELSLFGISFDTETTELFFNDIPMESVDSVESILPLMPQLTKVEMCNCGIPSEEMDALRKRNPNVEFVWLVHVGDGTIRTDIEAFIPYKLGYDIKNPLKDKDCTELKYCQDLICLDLGHMRMLDVSFLRYMPKMRYLILGDTPVRDFSALENLTELIYLEIFNTKFADHELLLGMTKLEDLNIGYTPATDVEVLKQMTWLKRLWLPSTQISLSDYESLLEALPDTQVVRYVAHSTAGGWRDNDNYRDMRDLLGMFYMD